MFAFGSNEILPQVSNTVFEVVISLPLLINKLNVPEAVFGETISHLILSTVPSANCPAEPKDEELFWFVPSDSVSSTNVYGIVGSVFATVELVALV